MWVPLLKKDCCYLTNQSLAHASAPIVPSGVSTMCRSNMPITSDCIDLGDFGGYPHIYHNTLLSII